MQAYLLRKMQGENKFFHAGPPGKYLRARPVREYCKFMKYHYLLISGMVLQ
jgi:hypothetical protein